MCKKYFKWRCKKIAEYEDICIEEFNKQAQKFNEELNPLGFEYKVFPVWFIYKKSKDGEIEYFNHRIEVKREYQMWILIVVCKIGVDVGFEDVLGNFTFTSINNDIDFFEEYFIIQYSRNSVSNWLMPAFRKYSYKWHLMSERKKFNKKKSYFEGLNETSG